jgi:hypothetical protein
VERGLSAKTIFIEDPKKQKLLSEHNTLEQKAENLNFPLDIAQAVCGTTQWFLALRKNVSESYE